MSVNKPIKQKVTIENGNQIIEKEFASDKVEESKDGNLYWHILTQSTLNKDDATGRFLPYMLIQMIGESPYPTVDDIPQEIIDSHDLSEWKARGSFDHEPTQEEIENILPKL